MSAQRHAAPHRGAPEIAHQPPAPTPPTPVSPYPGGGGAGGGYAYPMPGGGYPGGADDPGGPMPMADANTDRPICAMVASDGG
jgi:hypothetical protein